MSQRSDIIWLHKELANTQQYLLECALHGVSINNTVTRLEKLKKDIEIFNKEYREK